MTKFSFEVPYNHLEEFHPHQDFIFTLSLAYEDRRMQRYLHAVKQEGLRTIWLDNSFNEKQEADDPQIMKDLAYAWRPQKIICPDDPKWAPSQLYDLYCDMGSSIPVRELLCVANNWDCYEYLRNFGVRSFAVSYWTRSKNWTHEQLAKIQDLHFLGLLDMMELRAVRPASCDTSMPVKIALKN